MTYCSSCGAKISEDAFFCPNCGTKTPKGFEANVKYPSDELREAFNKAGMELEKAFTIAAREMNNAFRGVREEFNQKSKSEQASTVTCKNCGAANASDAIFCRSCGSKIQTA